MSRRTAIIIALFGLVLVAVGVFVIFNFIQAQLVVQPPPTEPPPLTQNVVVASHDISMGSVLDEGDLEEKEVPVDLAPAGVVQDAADILGRMTKIPLVAGELLMPHHLADPTNVVHDIGYLIGDNEVLIAFPAEDLLTSVNILQRGDLVDILASQPFQVETERALIGPDGEEQEPEEELFTFNALQRVQIQAVVAEIRTQARQQAQAPVEVAPGEEPAPQPTPVPQPSEVDTQAILLIVTPQDALVLKNLKDDGAIFDIALRSPTSTQLFEPLPVSPQFLIERYQLEVTR